jgi:iron complex outermembrane receptor protein
MRSTQGSHALRTAVFRRDGRELIDWVQWKPDSLQAENLTQVIMTGVSAGWTWTTPVSWMDQLAFGYTGMFSEADQLDVPSLYVLDQLRHKVVVQGRHSLGSLGISWMANFQDRAGEYVDFPSGEKKAYEPIFLLDLKVDYTFKSATLFVSGSNLLNKEYVDRGNVIQPGMWLLGGITIDIVR